MNEEGIFYSVFMMFFKLGVRPVMVIFGLGSVVFFVSSGQAGITIWFLIGGPVIAALSGLAWGLVCAVLAAIATAFSKIDDALHAGT